MLTRAARPSRDRLPREVAYFVGLRTVLGKGATVRAALLPLEAIVFRPVRVVFAAILRKAPAMAFVSAAAARLRLLGCRNGHAKALHSPVRRWGHLVPGV